MCLGISLRESCVLSVCFFFQAEDGIRDLTVTGVQTCALPIYDPRRADKAGAVLALVGVVNIPIIYFSVKWWNTLHQGASVSLTKAPTMAATMLRSEERRVGKECRSRWSPYH